MGSETKKYSIPQVIFHLYLSNIQKSGDAAFLDTVSKLLEKKIPGLIQAGLLGEAFAPISQSEWLVPPQEVSWGHAKYLDYVEFVYQLSHFIGQNGIGGATPDDFKFSKKDSPDLIAFEKQGHNRELVKKSLMGYAGLWD